MIHTGATRSKLNLIKKELLQYKSEVEEELENILDYWMKFTTDDVNGGFFGKLDHYNIVYPEAPKGSVLNARILWSFSAAYDLTKKSEYLEMAERAFEYLTSYFIDQEYGGVYWTVDYKGKPLDSKKQIYALSFAIYGLSEFYRASGNEAAKLAAISLYDDIVSHSYEQQYGGYIEALARDWKESSILRLSAKDANERKSMNTHLHVLEAFTNLYRVWPDEKLKEEIRELIHIFLDHIIAKDTFHLDLFFDDAWNPKSKLVSYGHDIEAAWLIPEAAETIGDKILLQQVNNRSLRLVGAAAKGLDGDGSLWYEYDVEKRKLIKQKHSWPQAEAMVGFFNAWQIAGDEKNLEQSQRSWQFVKKYIRDNHCGEWKWGVNEDYSTMDKEDKVGIWKCPYHNSRACIEITRRIAGLIT
jgi:mannobiose 2-epimerase